MKSRLLIFFGLFIFSISAWAIFFMNKTPDIAGSYTCQWRDAGKSAFFESTLLVTKLRTTYFFSWNSSNGKLYIGNGLFNGNNNRAIAVMYNLLGDPKLEEGIQLYILNPDGSLEGPWASNDKNFKGTSFCRKNQK